ncbi:peroxisomal 2,4-dienoyl-CoA reductase-like [Pyrus ussuriensis x Pyrus communis]|uniref:2,4-dienoyl-CoA reductase [(3E)-enoyl-CoA-producing] n=1 Tax=Pyrus ussuriensis x Pyrus communis TaxID=2448454 RepID=A0A5N5FKB6_9ROSA|nr:peroxisomal 2,4-dienoyl-CoA reductase-like [Pyrus ussuriensis x Pyrus communis]
MCAARVLESTVKHFGRLDILVNAAAGNFLCPHIDIDAVGAFRVCHEALKYLKKGASGKKNSSAGGSVINISATLHYTATWYQIHVSAAKVCYVIETFGSHRYHYEKLGVGVNGIAPGPIGDTAGFGKLSPQEMLRKPKEQMGYCHGCSVSFIRCSDVNGMNIDIGGKEIGASDGCTVNSDTNVCNTSVDGSVKESVLGPWMIVQTKRRAPLANISNSVHKSDTQKEAGFMKSTDVENSDRYD